MGGPALLEVIGMLVFLMGLIFVELFTTSGGTRKKGKDSGKVASPTKSARADRDPGEVIAEVELAVMALPRMWVSIQHVALQRKCAACLELIKALYRFVALARTSEKEALEAAKAGDQIFADIDTSGFAPGLAKKFQRGKRFGERVRAAKVLIEETYAYLVAMDEMGTDYPPSDHDAALDKFLFRGGKVLDPDGNTTTQKPVEPSVDLSVSPDASGETRAAPSATPEREAS